MGGVYRSATAIPGDSASARAAPRAFRAVAIEHPARTAHLSHLMCAHLHGLPNNPVPRSFDPDVRAIEGDHSDTLNRRGQGLLPPTSFVVAESVASHLLMSLSVRPSLRRRGQVGQGPFTGTVFYHVCILATPRLLEHDARRLRA